MTYNSLKNDVHFIVDTLDKYSEGRWKLIEKRLPKKDILSHVAHEATCHEDVETTRPLLLNDHASKSKRQNVRFKFLCNAFEYF